MMIFFDWTLLNLSRLLPPDPGVRLRRCSALLALCAVASAASASQAAPCEGAQRIQLRQPVTLTAQQRQALQAMEPLRVTAVSAPPLVRYDAASQRYTGIGPDVLCFISQQTGLRYQMLPARGFTVAEKIQQVQNGQLDLLMPLSSAPERARLGLFTQPYYDSYYAAIAPRGRRLELQSSADLARLRVGFVEGVVMSEMLQGLVPQGQWRTYQESIGPNGLFAALSAGEIDVALYNRDFFAQERFQHELFDLEVVHVLREFPRSYRFYLHRSPRHAELVQVMDQYLAAIDIRDSLVEHQDGERRLIERYVQQRNQRTLLQAVSLGIALLGLAGFLTLRHYRRLVRRLSDITMHVMQQQEQLLEANRRLEQLSQTDGLTGLANRRHFDAALAREHGRWQRTGDPLSLLMVDLDHFKFVNDHYGHAVGDDYLRAVARALQASVVRATDLAARYGGEEFVCLLPETDSHSAQQVAERIRSNVAALALPNEQAPARGCLTVSVGVATLTGGRHDALALQSEADAQLYAAKHAGRNRVMATVLTGA